MRWSNRTLAEPFPPNTLLFVTGLACPEYLIEVEAVAVVPKVSHE